MRKPFDGAHNMTVRKLERSDAAAYREFCRELGQEYGNNPDRYKSYWENDCAKLFEEGSSYVMFGLWDGNKMVGQTVLAFDPDAPEKLAVFCESEISENYTGHGYADHLYDVRKQFLKDIGFAGDVETHITPDNHPSLRAAARNGFTLTDDVIMGHCVLKGPQ